MEKELARPAVISATSDESALDWARRWLLILMGSRGWHDTHESMFARLGKRLAMNPRRVRAIIQKERHTRISGDEMLTIQRAIVAMEALSTLARDADAAAHSDDREESEGPLRQGNGAAR